MKPWFKRTLIGLVGASVLFGGLAACSHRPHGPGAFPMAEADVAKLRERVIDKATRELALDEAQKVRLGALADALKTQRQALLPGAGAAVDPRAEWQALVAGAQFDRARATALIDAKTQAVREHSPAVVSALADFYDTLRPEQQQKLRDLMSRRHGHFGWRS